MARVGTIGERQDLICRQGATLGPFSVTVKDSAGNPVDLTNMTVVGQIRKNALDSGNPVAIFTIDYVDRSAGRFDFSIASTVTATIPAGEFQKDADSHYVWDMQLHLPDKIVPLYYGDYENFRSVTRV